MKAKTYKSINGFISPQSLSSFGIKITNGEETKYLGLEEFNFCAIIQNYSYKGKHVAFIPCFSINREDVFIDQLELFYLEAPGVALHYATLYGVTQIQKAEIPSVRKDLIQFGFPEFVQNSLNFQDTFGQLFITAIEIWNRCFFNTNIIVAKGTDDRFVLNTFYEKIIFHNPKIQVNWSNLNRARLLYP